MNQSEAPLFQWQKIKAYFRNPENLKNLIKVLVFYGTIYGVFLYLSSSFGITPEYVRERFAGTGLLLAPILIGAQVLASLTPLPDLPFNAGAILFFQPVGAFFIILFGMWIGTILNFSIARKLGKDLVHRKYPQTANWIDRFTGKYWFETVVVGRSFVFVTFDLVSYAAGVSTLEFKRFAFASAFGLIPVSLNATLLGLALTAGDPEKTVLYTGFSALLAVIIGYMGKLFRKKDLPTDTTQSQPV